MLLQTVTKTLSIFREVTTTQKKVPSVFVIKMEKVNGDNYIHLGELACISYLIQTESFFTDITASNTH